MRYRPLGKTGLSVSEIGLGTWPIGGPFESGGQEWGYAPTTERESIKIIERAVELGINLIDTADVYGLGRSETIIGKALGKRRKGITLATKVGYLPEPLKSTYPAISKKDYIVKCLEGSLRRLKAEAVDLYQLHNPSIENLKADFFETARELKKEGKILHIGVSPSTIEEAKFCLEVPDCETLQISYSLAEANLLEELGSDVEAKGVGVLVKNPLRNGMLTGKYSANTPLPEIDWRSRAFPAPTRSKFARFADEARKLLRADQTLAQLALAWVLANPAVSAAIPGARSTLQVEANAHVAETEVLSAEIVEELSAVFDTIFRE